LLAGVVVYLLSGLTLKAVLNRIMDWIEAHVVPIFFIVVALGGIAMGLPPVKAAIKALLGQ